MKWSRYEQTFRKRIQNNDNEDDPGSWENNGGDARNAYQRLRRTKEQKPEIAEKSEWVSALGGSDNIISSEAYGSRLAVKLKDKNLMNKEALKQLGVTNFIEMSDKITLLLEDKAELVKAELDKE